MKHATAGEKRYRALKKGVKRKLPQVAVETYISVRGSVGSVGGMGTAGLVAGGWDRIQVFLCIIVYM